MTINSINNKNEIHYWAVYVIYKYVLEINILFWLHLLSKTVITVMLWKIIKIQHFSYQLIFLM